MATANINTTLVLSEPAIADALESQGYNIVLGYNLGKDELYNAVNDFVDRIDNYKDVVIYYALDTVFKWTRADNTPRMSAIRGLDNSMVLFSTAENTMVSDHNQFAEILASEIKKGGCSDDIIRSLKKQVASNNKEQLIRPSGILDQEICFGTGGTGTPSSPPFFTDNDGDGISNNLDQCPNEKGPISNNGCPLPTVLEDMVFTQGGTFKMGSNEGNDDEKPIHSVTLSSYYMGALEVNRGAFAELVNERGKWLFRFVVLMTINLNNHFLR